MNKKTRLAHLALFTLTLAGACGGESQKEPGTFPPGNLGGAPTAPADLPGAGGSGGMDQVPGTGATDQVPGTGATDQVPGTGGTTVVTPPDPDADRDGVSAELDLCPDTAPATSVNASGCSDAQRAAGVADVRASTPDMRPATPDGVPAGAPVSLSLDRAPGVTRLANGFVTIEVHNRFGGEGIAFKTLEANVRWDGQTLHATGSLVIPTGNGDAISLLEAEVQFTRSDTSLYKFDRLTGKVRVPAPDLGFLSGAKMKDPVKASIGLAYGAELKDLKVPLKDERQYLFFAHETALAIQAGTIEIAAEAGGGARLALDPQDPFFYVGGNLSGLGSLMPVQAAGIGLSAQGLIPYKPQVAMPGAQVPTFDGNVYLNGTVSLVKLPIAVTGATTLRLGNLTSPSFEDEVAYGSNGAAAISFALSKAVSLTVPLVKTSIVGRLAKDRQDAYVAGELTVPEPLLKDIVPVFPKGTLTAAGYLSSQIEDSYLRLEGELALGTAQLAARAGIIASELVTVTGSARVDWSGVEVRGKATASLHPDVRLRGDAEVHARFGADPNDWFVRMTGEIDFRDVGLQAGATLVLDKNGLRVEGGLRAELPVEWVSDSLSCVTSWTTELGRCTAGTATKAYSCGQSCVTKAVNCVEEVFKTGLACVRSGFKNCKRKVCQYVNECAPQTCYEKGCNLTTCSTNSSLLPAFGHFEGRAAFAIGPTGVAGSASGQFCTNVGCTTIGGARFDFGSGATMCVTVPNLGQVMPAGLKLPRTGSEICGKL